MKIDTHQHYWHYHPSEFAWITDAMPALQQDCMPQDCESAMRSADVDGVVAVQARTVIAETDFLLALADQHPHIWGVVGWADLAAPDLSQHLERWTVHPAMRGIRHILQDEADVCAWLSHPPHSIGLHAVQTAGLVYDVLVFDHQLPAVASFCAKHDAHWLVLDHVGKPAIRHWKTHPEVCAQWRSNLHTLAALPHVMGKLSGWGTETLLAHTSEVSAADTECIWACFDHALGVFGPNRLMFGSDWPVCQLATPYDLVHGVVQKWVDTRLSLSEQEAFWSGNAMRCYALNVNSKR
jgi:L-fuconolactonase